MDGQAHARHITEQNEQVLIDKKYLLKFMVFFFLTLAS